MCLSVGPSARTSGAQNNPESPRLAALTPLGRTNRNREALAKWRWLLSAEIPFMKQDFLGIPLELQ